MATKQNIDTKTQSNAQLGKKSKDFIISRVLDAPRQLVWDAFTQPARMKDWWGPKGAKVLQQKMDFRVGGSYLYGMSFANQDMWGKFVYREIAEPEKMVLVNSFSDKNGGVTRHPMSATWPLQMLTTFTFAQQGNKTLLTITWSPIDPTPAEQKTFDEGHASMTQGWSGTFEQLEAYLAGPQKK